MKTDLQILEQIHDWGHFYSPEALAIGLVKRNELPSLALDSPAAVAAMQSFQKFMQLDIEPLVFKHHHRMLIADGKFGPATRDLIDMPRCACPDYQDPSKAVGDGSWPEPCQKGGVKVYIDNSNMPSSVASRWADIQATVFAAYAEIGLKMVTTSDPSQANIRSSWRVLAGSTIGLAEFNSQSCNPASWVFCYMDPGYTQYLKSLWAHELGHNCNLQHRSQYGIMHPSIQADPSPFTWKGDPSHGDLIHYFGGDPIAPPPTPPAPPIPPSHPPVTGSLFGEPFGSGFVIRGDVQFDGKWKYVATPEGGGKYKLVPKAEV